MEHRLTESRGDPYLGEVVQQHQEGEEHQEVGVDNYLGVEEDHHLEVEEVEEEHHLEVEEVDEEHHLEVEEVEEEHHLEVEGVGEDHHLEVGQVGE